MYNDAEERFLNKISVPNHGEVNKDTQIEKDWELRVFANFDLGDDDSTFYMCDLENVYFIARVIGEDPMIVRQKFKILLKTKKYYVLKRGKREEMSFLAYVLEDFICRCKFFLRVLPSF